MAWLIVRHTGPGEHSLASQVLVFDEQGQATTDDAEAVAVAMAFPELFTVTTGGEASAPPTGEGATGDAGAGLAGSPSGEPSVASGYTHEELELLTVADLRELAAAAEITGNSRMTKNELVEALLAHQARG